MHDNASPVVVHFNAVYTPVLLASVCNNLSVLQIMYCVFFKDSIKYRSWSEQGRQRTPNVNIVARSRSYCYHRKAINMSCVSILDLVIHHAKRVRRIILSSVSSLAVPHFRHYLITDTIFRKKFIEH